MMGFDPQDPQSYDPRLYHHHHHQAEVHPNPTDPADTHRYGNTRVVEDEYAQPHRGNGQRGAVVRRDVRPTPQPVYKDYPGWDMYQDHYTPRSDMVSHRAEVHHPQPPPRLMEHPPHPHAHPHHTDLNPHSDLHRPDALRPDIHHGDFHHSDLHRSDGLHPGHSRSHMGEGHRAPPPSHHRSHHHVYDDGHAYSNEYSSR